jgi:ubiquitin C-terminal hydrolase
MSYVEFNVKNLARMLSIMSDYFGKKEMSEDDVELRKKLEVMHKSEIEWQKEQEEENKEDSI